MGHMEGGSDTRFSGVYMRKGWYSHTVAHKGHFSETCRGLADFPFNSLVALAEKKLCVLIVGQLRGPRNGGGRE